MCGRLIAAAAGDTQTDMSWGPHAPLAADDAFFW